MQVLKSYIFNDSQDLNFLGKVLFSLAVILACWLIIKIVKKIVNVKLNLPGNVSYAKINTIRGLLFNFLRVAIIFIGLVTILETFGINTNSIIATAGIGGVAIGFGAQYIVRDYISGMVIIGEDQYRVGELVKIDGYEGYVEDVGLRLTKLRDFDGNLHIIQNGSISVVTNQARGPKLVRSEIFVSKDADMAKVNKALESAVKRMNGGDKKDKIEEDFENLGIGRLTDFAAVYYLNGMVEPESQWMMNRELRKIALEELKKEGIELQQKIDSES